MRFEPLPLQGAFLVHTEGREDDRGRFVRVFCEERFEREGLPFRPVQCNLSLTTRRGTVRGMHFQRGPAAEAKLVRPIAGAVWDVIVDLRPRSPSFLRWHAVTLDAARQAELLIPQGMAHGFQALTDDAQLLYFHSQAYSATHEDGLRHDDPRLGITWPLPVINLSPRDGGFAPIDERFEGVAA